jgi:hypothetical protein
MTDFRFRLPEDFRVPSQRKRFHAEVRELINADPSLRTKPAQIVGDARAMSRAEWMTAIDAVRGVIRGGRRFEKPQEPARSGSYTVAELNQRRARGE